MLKSTLANRGMVVAPHHLAAQAGLSVLRDGGNALEAAVATAAALAVVYPHMTGIGGDAFWLFKSPGSAPVSIDGAGRLAMELDACFYNEHGYDAIPTRGPLAANSVAGAVSAWDKALDYSTRLWQGRMPLSRILADAITYAETGYPVTESQARTTSERTQELREIPGFAAVFLDQGLSRPIGATERNPALAETLRQIARHGSGTFYRGELATIISDELWRIGSPVRKRDLYPHQADFVTPLTTNFAGGQIYNTAPPSQGLASLMILALFERAGGLETEPDSPEYIHLLVEATKLTFQTRDRYVSDPQDMSIPASELLSDERLDALAAKIRPDSTLPWRGPGDPGDTTWFGVVDSEGRAVSAIQSLYHEYGSGVVLQDTGIVWQNRGISFSLQPDTPRSIAPARKPFHTLNPALAELKDGRTLVYGSMGGDGQPQTQAALLSRIAGFDVGPQDAITRPRWLLGRTWGNPSTSLKLENRFPQATVEALARLGHDVEPVGAFDEMVGHAGAISRRTDGLLEGGFDPRSDGCVAAY
ncbi:gamma-glutamyltransferase [Halothiobacillus diazotrophicus]|uniref:Gamma-glutamyltransferase n=1 Tax=Halothiobacillus diazotrophicus TaxID=1860122 RepID=A0A191ZFI2_9GAMM|nr:gamma-glutamyltransferase family protein [Halothiobacillus diazotrophicus]ANJ66639.1 gamma-glutamyltransferase [Halothiobacillus diazotrophicus]